MLKSKGGYIVETKSGLTGKVYHGQKLIGGKVAVRYGSKRILCNPKDLTIKGFIN